MDKIFVVFGIIPYESKDVMGIYTDKDKAIRDAQDIAARPDDAYSSVTHYSIVEVHSMPLNATFDGMMYSNKVWSSK